MSIGKAVSWLARRGAQAHMPLAIRNGFAVFPIPDSDARFGLDEVRTALDADDQARARDFLSPVSPA